MMKKTVILFSLVFFAIACGENDEIISNESTASNTTSDFNGASFGNSGSGSGSAETYNTYEENDFIKTSEEVISTFSIDADGGSYSNIRNQINEGLKVEKYSIRTEEIINYFQYDYEDNSGVHPISLNGEIAKSPWSENKLLRIGIKGKNIAFNDLPPSNLVFLIDVSGSMQSENKLSLLKESFKLLVENLRKEDRVAIVTYASNPGVALKSTSCNEKNKIIDAIDALAAGGSTNGSGGIESAYVIAEQNFVSTGNNRIIIASDGDFNVGVTDHDALLDLIEEKREKGIFLTTIGVGRGNYNDANMEQIANHGNGTYEYIDNINQAKKVFIEEFSKFYTVAKDVKVQVAFNPRLVDAYRLIGYENRVLENEDFEDDTKDAGEIGAGQTITAIYEIVPANNGVNPLSEQTFSIDFKYKLPDEDQSKSMQLMVVDNLKEFNKSSQDMQFACSMAALGMYLFDSKYKGDITISKIKNWVDKADSYDPNDYKKDLKSLLKKIN
jgi:Ca-activated chloride channel family protein